MGTAPSRIVAGTADPVAGSREGQNRSEDLGGERRAEIGVAGGAAAEDAAEVEHLDGVAGGEGFRDLALVAAKRPACAEHPGEDIARAQADEPAGGILDLVVDRLVAVDAHRQDPSLLAENLGADEDLRSEAGVAGR